MGYEVRLHRNALKQLKRLDRQVARRITDYLDEVASLDNPRDRGKSLRGDRAGIWRYRVGEFRVLCAINDRELVVLALDVRHRRNIYD